MGFIPAAHFGSIQKVIVMSDQIRRENAEKALAWLLDEIKLVEVDDSITLAAAISHGEEVLKWFDTDQDATAEAMVEERRERAVPVFLEEGVDDE